MIDLFIANGALGMPQPSHQACLSTVTHTRFLQAKAKASTTFILSPITEVQIDVKYWVELVGGVATAFAQVRIPLASATMGQNYAHAGLDSIQLEVTCASLLVKITLTALGFTPAEVTSFMATAKTQLLELTWHTATASKRARLSAQRRTKEHFDAQQSVSSRHDISVADVYYEEGKGKPGILVKLKTEDLFRQYGKADQISSRTMKNRNQARMSREAQQFRQLILDEIEDHVRNETLIGAKTFKQFGLEHPGTWTPENLKKVIEFVWEQAGLAPKLPHGILSPEAEATWQRYMNREDLVKALPAHTFTRHRASIMAAKGDDIAVRRKSRAIRPESLGRQLCYERRWEPSGELRKTVLCEQTAPAIIEELRCGLAFLETRQFPNINGGQPDDKLHWKWIAFAQREGDRHHGIK